MLDFKTCPQLFRYRAIDRLPEPEDPSSARGSLVHFVLETLLADDPSMRTAERAYELLDDSWEQLELPQRVFDEAKGMLTNYFKIEDPSRIGEGQLEWFVEHEWNGLHLRGIIDRLEIDEEGEWVLSDYKTSRSPSDSFVLGAFFGLKFYALVCWRAFGKIPRLLRLVHLKEPEVISLVPTEEMLEALERQLKAVGQAIGRAVEKEDFRPRPGRMCGYCPHQSICPAMKQTEAAAG